MTDALPKRGPGRPRGVPAAKRFALECAYQNLLWQIEGRPPRARPAGWTRTHVRLAAARIATDLRSLGFRVGERSVRDAINDPAPMERSDGREYDTRRGYPASIRYAAALLIFGDGADLSRYGPLVDAIYAWCVAQHRAGRHVPLDAVELALAFQGNEIRAEK